MRVDFREIKTLADDYGPRTCVLSPFSYALLLSLVGVAAEVFYWSDLEANERVEAVDLIDRMIREMSVNPTLGWVLPISGTVPDNMLLCDGSTYNRVDYPELWEVLDSVFKVDADTFRLPDLRGRTVFGQKAGWLVGDTGGEDEHTLTVEEIPAHAHTYTAPMIGDLDFEDVGVPQPATSINPIPQSTSSVGSGQPHNNLPPYQVLKWAMVVR